MVRRGPLLQPIAWHDARNPLECPRNSCSLSLARSRITHEGWCHLGPKGNVVRADGLPVDGDMVILRDLKGRIHVVADVLVFIESELFSLRAEEVNVASRHRCLSDFEPKGQH